NTFVDILRAILLSLEILIEDPELQINGFMLIIDWSNFTFKQASKLTPTILRLAIEGLQDSFPARFGGIHFVNQPWYIHALYTIIKPFLKDKTRKRIFLHGNNLNSLHQLIHPEYLPSEFGGTLPPYDMGTWARTLLGKCHEQQMENECAFLDLKKTFDAERPHGMYKPNLDVLMKLFYIDIQRKASLSFKLPMCVCARAIKFGSDVLPLKLICLLKQMLRLTTLE
ncbi:hypothetical protein scyTo_0005177, partial [Scyliorhinus torazame]|nr:hypothetical protein [Scyliorhinus torazame]